LPLLVLRVDDAHPNTEGRHRALRLPSLDTPGTPPPGAETGSWRRDLPEGSSTSTAERPHDPDPNNGTLHAEQQRGRGSPTACTAIYRCSWEYPGREMQMTCARREQAPGDRCTNRIAGWPTAPPDRPHGAPVASGMRRSRRYHAALASEYRFVDRWVVPHPIERVFAAVGEPLRYPQWWSDVFLEAAGDGGDTGIRVVDLTRALRDRLANYLDQSALPISCSRPGQAGRTNPATSAYGCSQQPSSGRT